MERPTDHPTTYLEEVCETTFGDSSAESSLRRSNDGTTDKETYFTVMSHQNGNKNECLTSVGCTVDGHLAWTCVLVVDEELTLEKEELFVSLRDYEN